MLTFNKLLPRGAGLAPVLTKRAPQLELDWDVRQKSRFDATDSQGRRCGVFLPRGTVVRGGDVLVAEDGSLVIAKAAPQPVLRVTPCPQHGTPADLARAAYHLGNRHVQLEVNADHLQLEPDHVLAAMLRQMHLIVTEVNHPFEPEAGAYASAAHGNGDEHEHVGHAHDHPHEASAAASGAAPAAAHVHGPGCTHGESHDHDHGQSTTARSHAAPVATPAAATAKPTAAAHVHGPGCAHGHDHGHPDH